MYFRLLKDCFASNYLWGKLNFYTAKKVPVNKEDVVKFKI
jgi:hypothetical protein